MEKVKKISPQEYQIFLQEIREVIFEKQLEAFQKVNKSLIELYWNIGKKIVDKLEENDWGKAVVKNLSYDLQKEFPEVSGFSERNLWRMRNFYAAYRKRSDIHHLLAEVSWSHHVTIMEKVKDSTAQKYYMLAIKRYGWTNKLLVHQIENGSFERFVLADSNNFDKALPEHIRHQAKLSIKDHYIFDFLEMGVDELERELEKELLDHLQEFILELGFLEFTFVGRQVRVTVEGEDFYIDLLFYHRSLNCLVALELKTVKFIPEYAGKMNFYLTALDRLIRKNHENPSIGIILCKEKIKQLWNTLFQA